MECPPTSASARTASLPDFAMEVRILLRTEREEKQMRQASEQRESGIDAEDFAAYLGRAYRYNPQAASSEKTTRMSSRPMPLLRESARPSCRPSARSKTAETQR